MSDVAALMVELAPLMQELLRLRVEVVRLRNERAPVLPDDLAELTRGTPLELKKSGDGRWDFRLDLGGYNYTGGGSYDTPRQAFIAALEHVRTYLARREAEWTEEE
jgi:hypothetical protein